MSLFPTVDASLNHPFATVAQEAIVQASRCLKRYFRKEVSIQVKGKSDFVSQADLESQSSIVAVLQKAFPDHLIIAEEGLHVTEDHEHVWIVDPLDGTSNFLHGIPHFAISIAYLHHGVPTMGMVYNPMIDDFYYAAVGEGAWWNGKQLHVSEESALDQSMVAVGFYYDRGRMMEATLQAIAEFFRNQVHGVRRFGAAALDLCNVARGDYGVFFEYKLHPWDHAAGGLIVAEAGGQVSDCLGKPLQFKTATSILASNRHLHPAALQITQKHHL